MRVSKRIGGDQVSNDHHTAEMMGQLLQAPHTRHSATSQLPREAGEREREPRRVSAPRRSSVNLSSSNSGLQGQHRTTLTGAAPEDCQGHQKSWMFTMKTRSRNEAILATVDAHSSACH